MILAKLIFMMLIFKPKHKKIDYLNILIYKLLKYILISSFLFNRQDPVGSSHMGHTGAVSHMGTGHTWLVAAILDSTALERRNPKTQHRDARSPLTETG